MTLVCSSVSAGGSDHPGFSIVEGNQVWVHQPLPPSRLREKYQHHGFKVLQDRIVKGDVPKYVLGSFGFSECSRSAPVETLRHRWIGFSLLIWVPDARTN